MKKPYLVIKNDGKTKVEGVKSLHMIMVKKGMDGKLYVNYEVEQKKKGKNDEH